METDSEIEYSELFIDHERKRVYCHSVLEQLGRMIVQDRYSKEDVITIAKIAAKARHDGYSVKDIERYIRSGRKTGEW